MNIRDGFLVNETINGAHKNPALSKYPLLPGDIIVPREDGTWFKECPGVAIGGFILTEGNAKAITPIRFVSNGLSYTIVGEADHAVANMVDADEV